MIVEWQRGSNMELYELHSPNIMWVSKSRRIKWAGHGARMGERGKVDKDFCGET